MDNCHCVNYAKLEAEFTKMLKFLKITISILGSYLLAISVKDVPGKFDKLPGVAILKFLP